MSVIRTAAGGDFDLAAAEGGVAAPTGFRSAGVHCGIKKAASALDLTIIAADGEASAAGIFTTNLAKAAPVLVSRRHLERSGGLARGVVVNSGCANACTGDKGMSHAARMSANSVFALTLGITRADSVE